MNDSTNFTVDVDDVLHRKRIDFQGDHYLESARVASVRPDGVVRLTKADTGYPLRKTYTVEQLHEAGWRHDADGPEVRDDPRKRWWTEFDFERVPLNTKARDIREFDTSVDTALVVSVVRSLGDDGRPVHFDPTDGRVAV